MYNIAGYVGTKQAAPILLEMLKKQESMDLGFSTPIWGCGLLQDSICA